MNEATRLISTHRAAQILGKHRWTIWHWWKTGMLEAAVVIETGDKQQPMFDLDYISNFAKETKPEKVA